MAKKAEYDPWILYQEEHKKVQNENKGGAAGVICNKRNPNINKTCYVCLEVQKLFASKDPAKKEIAYQKMAKANWYMNVVTESNPEEVIILEVGKKAGNDIIDGIHDSGWIDIAHPLANKGREMTIVKKVEDGHNKYKVSPCLEKADWSIPESVLTNLPNLDNIISILGDPSVPYKLKRISELKVDESFKFRICPPWKSDSDFVNKRVITSVWRHWGGVTQEEIDGIVPVDLSLPNFDNKGVTTEVLDTDNVHEIPQQPGKTMGKTKPSKPPECYGKSDWFDANDKECTACLFFNDCKRDVEAA